MNVIVKVQLSQPDRERCLIYTKGREFVWEGKSTPHLKRLMEKNGHFSSEASWKSFFHAKMVLNAHGGVRFTVGSRAPWQDW